MKRYSIFLLVTLAISASAMGSTEQQRISDATHPAALFFGGCGLILLTVAHLGWKTRRIGK
jgi:hypothetical protein